MENVNFNKDRSVTITSNNVFINKSLLRLLLYGCYDDDGYEYAYNLFELAINPAIDQFFRNTI